MAYVFSAFCLRHLLRFHEPSSGACAGLGRLLQDFSEETLHIVLETLTAVIRADAAAAAAWEPRVSPALLRLWAANVSDPLIALDATEAIQALAANPAALPSLQVRARDIHPGLPSSP